METQEIQIAQEWAQNAGIMTGYADGQMRLDNTVTRGSCCWYCIALPSGWAKRKEEDT
jgi:hypothetical protein